MSLSGPARSNLQFVHYRQATVADVPEMARSRLDDPAAGPADSRMAAYLEGTHHPQRALAPRVAYVVLDGDAVVGYIAGHLTERYACDGELQYLFVAPQFRRSGIATALLRLLARWFTERGALKICVDVNLDSPAALPFYTRHGAEALNKHWLVWHDIRSLAGGNDRTAMIAFEMRRANAADAQAIALAHRDSIASIGPRFYPPDVVNDWSAGLTPDLYLRAMQRGEVFFVAVGEIDGKPALLGFSSHRVDATEHGTAVYVRGSAARSGVGSALFRLAEADAIASGATSIQIDASLASVEFYKAHGFEEVGRREHRLPSGRPMACVFMRKTLRPTNDAPR
jgi:ribosomal protein S18 acetylase RimI-like enzyme